MKNISIPRISLRFKTLEEAQAAQSAIDFSVRAAGSHCDVYEQTAPTITQSQGFDFGDYLNTVTSAHVFTSPEGDTPRRIKVMSGVVSLKDLHLQPSGTHVMIDLETLGTRPGSALLSLGAVGMTPRGLSGEFYAVFDVAEQAALGMTSHPDTIAWWESQSPEARTVLSAPQEPVRDVLRKFNTWLRELGTEKDVRIWGNGADFDNPLLIELYRVVALDPGWRFYNNRCYRTVKNMFRDVAMAREGTYHNALDDARSQANHFIRIANEHGLWATV